MNGMDYGKAGVNQVFRGPFGFLNTLKFGDCV